MKYGIVCSAVLLSLTFATAADAAGVVFRYLPGSASLSSSVEMRDVEAGPYLDPRERTARGPGSWGYDAPWTANFEAPGSALWETTTEDANQPLGPKVTAEIWVRMLELGEVHTLLTNRVGTSDGFTLGLEGEIPYFEMVVNGTAYRVDGRTAVEEGEDTWLTATAEYEGSGSLNLVLYRDGAVEARAETATSLGTPYVMRHPFFVGTEAAGSDESPTLAGTLTGLVYAAIVRDYLADADYLSTPPPFDGSAYFGLPDFHDYELDSFRFPMDQRISTYETDIARKVYLPHVNDEFIPQGTAVVSDETTGDVDLVYVAYYHRTRDGQLRTQRSIIAEIDAETGAVRRTFRLMGRLETSHAGGIAVAGGALYVSSAGFLERYPIPTYISESDRYIDLEPDADGSTTVASKASFVSAFADTLWVGDYRTNSEQQPYLFGYPLDESGRLVGGSDPAIYPLPRYIQGVDLFTHDGTTFVFLSRNRNSTEGEVLRLRRSDLDPNSIPSWDASFTFPHGIEDLAFARDGTLWTNSESGTDYYQRTAEWPSFYPFAYGVERVSLFPPPTLVETPGEQPSDLRLTVYPNPATDRVTVSFAMQRAGNAHVRVLDTLGREIATLVRRPLGGGQHTAVWDVGDTAQGVYLVVVEVGERRRFRKLTVVR